MTLPTSGPLAVSQMRTEFTGPTPSRMSNYYRGGSFVPNTGTNAAVPTSGQIKISNFYGASAATGPAVTIQNGHTWVLSRTAPGTTSTVATFLTCFTSGVCQAVSGSPSPANWSTPTTAGVGSFYEGYLNPNGDPTPSNWSLFAGSAAINTWVDMATAPSWTRAYTGNAGTLPFTPILQFRLKTNPGTIYTNFLTLTFT